MQYPLLVNAILSLSIIPGTQCGFVGISRDPLLGPSTHAEHLGSASMLCQWRERVFEVLQLCYLLAQVLDRISSPVESWVKYRHTLGF